MAGRKTLVQLEYNSNVESLLKEVDKLMNGSHQPDLIYIKFSSAWFPRRELDMPDELNRLFHVNPKIKACWDAFLDVSDEYKVDGDEDIDVSDEEGDDNVDGKFQRNEMGMVKTLDMTLITCHHGGKLNKLRKDAMKQALENWLIQSELPSQMIFLELVIGNESNFKQSDFPDNIRYIRISGHKNNKNIFQKECLWNIGVKLADYEKLVFIDYDTAPIGDCNWFRKIYDELDASIFTQGFRRIKYLDSDGGIVIDKKSISYDVVNCLLDANNPVPGGAFCTTKSAMQAIGGFNDMCFYGGGDNLFFNEILDRKSKYRVKSIQVELLERKTIYNRLLELSDKQGKRIIGSVDEDIYHFFHGNLSNRSYSIRTYLALMLFPVMNYFYVDDIGLLAWKNIDTPLYDMFGNIELINNSMENAKRMIGDKLDLGEWKLAIDKVQNGYYVNKSLPLVKRMLYDAKTKFGV